MSNVDLKTWDSGANDYLEVASEENDDFKNHKDTPEFINLLGDLKGKRILDIGCGNGDFCRRLSEAGAKVVGLDGSENMIKAAKVNFTDSEYVVCDLMNDDIPFENVTFDIVTSKMMLMNISSLKVVGTKILRVLKPNGLFGIDVLHPFRPIIKNLSQSNSSYSKDFNYFEETKGEIFFNNKSFAFYYRPVNQYLNDFASLGFQFLKMHEPFIDETFLKKFPREEKRLKTPISLHLLFKK